MNKYLNFVALFTALFINGCIGLAPKSDSDPVRKQIEACGAGFGSNVSTKLVADYDLKKKELEGKANAGIEASVTTSTSIINLLPESARLEGYKAYTDCLKSKISYPAGSEPLNASSILEKKN